MGEELPHALIGTLTTTLRTWLDGLQSVLEVETSKLESLLHTTSLRYRSEEASGPSVTVASQSSDAIPRPDLCNQTDSLKHQSMRQHNSNHLVEVIGLDNAESDFESKFGPFTPIVRTLLNELRCVFEVETSKLEALFRASVLRLGTTLPCQSEVPSDPAPYLHPCALVADSLHGPRERKRSAASQLATNSPVSFSMTSSASSTSQPNLQRRRRPVLDQAEDDMAESSFQAKFGPGGLGLDGRTLVPAIGSSFASPLPIVQDALCEDECNKVTVNSNSTARDPLRFVIGAIPFVVARLCGVIPWDGRWKQASSAYQWGVVMSLCGCLGGQFFEIAKDGKTRVSMDVCFTIGTLLSLLACGILWRSSSFVHCTARLDAYIVAHACRHRVDSHSCVEIACSLFVLVVVTIYFGINDDKFTAMECIFVVVGFFFCGIQCYVMHMVRIVGWLVDFYFEQAPPVLSEHLAKEAIKEWFRIDSLCRLVSSTVQNCLLSFQLTATVLICFLIADHLRGNVSPEFIVPTVLCALSVLRIALGAASVSEKCTKLPRLLIKRGNGEMEPGRKHLVEYIAHCNSGFFLFGMRLSCELVFKLLYGCCTATVAFVSQSVLKNHDPE